MDNVTHSLAGLLLAEGAIRIRSRRAGVEPSARFKRIAAIGSMIAANLPDADLFYTGVGGDKLTYLLHHRGYTHTIVGAMFGAALLWGIIALLPKRRGDTGWQSADARWILALVLVSTMSHLLLDWTNSYGVHPFWPLDNHWHYGDSVFIVEPWLWVVSVPTLVAASGRRAARVLLSVVLLIGLALAWRVAMVSAGAATALTVGAALSIAIAGALAPTTRITASIASWVAITLLIVGASRQARAAVLEAAHTADPAAEVLDVVVSAQPANVVCLTAISVERSRAMYRVVTAQVSSAAFMKNALECGSQGGADGMLQRSARLSSPSVHWDNEWSAPAAELLTLANASCPALAALRFIRVPIWRRIGDSAVVLGDVRYGGGSGGGCSDVWVPRRSTTCPRRVPPWTPPRADLLVR
jgi:inner membrane protein